MAISKTGTSHSSTTISNSTTEIDSESHSFYHRGSPLLTGSTSFSVEDKVLASHRGVFYEAKVFSLHSFSFSPSRLIFWHFSSILGITCFRLEIFLGRTKENQERSQIRANFADFSSFLMQQKYLYLLIIRIILPKMPVLKCYSVLVSLSRACLRSARC